MVRPFVVKETDSTILTRCLDSFDLWALKEDDSLTPCLVRDGYWESWITSWFTNNISEGDFVVDIGANCGYFTMLFERLTGPTGMVVAYEANPVYAELLKQTREHNGAQFVVENLAVSDTTRPLTLTYPGRYTGSASVVASEFNPQWGETHSIQVESTTLDLDFESMQSPDIIKIDAEGAEETIWRGARELLGRHNAPVVVMEYTPGYSRDFNNELFVYGEVTRIGIDGEEYAVNVEYLNTLQDWDMLVIRKR